MYLELTLLSYTIDYFFGEFNKIKSLKHPIIYMGEYIKWFESRYYKDSIFRGFLLTLSLLVIVFTITYILYSSILVILVRVILVYSKFPASTNILLV